MRKRASERLLSVADGERGRLVGGKAVCSSVDISRRLVRERVWPYRARKCLIALFSESRQRRRVCVEFERGISGVCATDGYSLEVD